MISLRVPRGWSARASRKSWAKRSPAVMSRLLADLDRTLGTVGHRQPCLVFLVRRHDAVAEDRSVAFVVLAEQTRGQVVAAAVFLAAPGVDLHFHCAVPVCLTKEGGTEQSHAAHPACSIVIRR